MNRNRWILAGAVLAVILSFGYYMWPTATVVKPPTIYKVAPAKKAVVNAKPTVSKPEAPSKQMTVVDEKATPAPAITVAAPVPTQTIVNNNYYYSAPPKPSSVTEIQPVSAAKSTPQSVQQPASQRSPTRTMVNILSGNSFSLNFLSGNGSGRWNSGGSHREEVPSDEPQAP